jgi:hypothetical protein
MTLGSIRVDSLEVVNIKAAPVARGQVELLKKKNSKVSDLVY